MTLMASAVFIHLHRHADRITRRAGEDPQGAAPCRGLVPLRYLEKVTALRQQRTCQHIRARCTLCE
jgi:hypothetical protein